MADSYEGVGSKTHAADISTEMTDSDPQREAHNNTSNTWRELDGWFRWRRSLGIATIAVLLPTIPLNLVVMGFLSFLWYGGPHYSFWLSIMCKNWATRAVTIPSLLIRTCSDLQAGAATAMMAALVLEGSSIPLRDAAKWSIARASRPRPRTLFLPLFRKAGAELDATKFISRIAIVLLCITVLILQFASTILLSDLSLGPLPGQIHEGSILYNLMYPQQAAEYLDPTGNGLAPTDERLYSFPNRIPTWRRNPPAYPAFAEYSKPISTNQGIDDTGTLLRAFLPYSDAVNRQNLRNYTGKAVVLDNRVSCQAPQLANLVTLEHAGAAYRPLNNPNISWEYFTTVQINGTVSPTDRTIDKLWTPIGDIPFSCVVSIGTNSTSICQLNILDPGYLTGDIPLSWNSAGGLLSEFSNLTREDAYQREHANETMGPYTVPAFITWGTPLLILRTIESGPVRIYQDPAITHPYDQTKKLHPTASTPGDVPWSIITEDVEWHPWKVSASPCYAAWDTATLNVNMNDDTNRTEPLAHWTRDGHLYTTPNVTNQLLGNRVSSADAPGNFEDRHILRLQEKDSWTPAPEDHALIAAMPFVQAYSDLSGNSQSPGKQMAPNWTALLMKDWQVTTVSSQLPTDMQIILADDTLFHLFDELMKRSNNSIAQSVAALITVLSGMAYYDELPLFQAETNVTQGFFTDVLFPQRIGGFWAIVTVVALHSLLIAAVTLAFLLRSKMSFVGNYWHSAVQLLSEDTKMVFAHGSMHTDKDVRQNFGSNLDHSRFAQLVRDENESSAHIRIGVRERYRGLGECI